MIETLLSWTELPNLHPALVHFPIALAVLGLLFELGGTLRGRPEWLDRAAAATWAAAALGAWAAWWAGRRAVDSLTVPPAVQGHVNTHSDWGLYTLWTLVAVALLRLAVALWRPAPRDGRRWPALFLLLGLGATGVVIRTADLGGGLVFRHGLAVRIASGPAQGEQAESREGRREVPDAAGGPGGSPAPTLRVADDGTRTWTPGPRAAEALGTLFTSLAGDAPPGLSATGEEGGALLRIDGSGHALLEEACGDVQVEADVAFAGFEGTFGLAHHVRDDGSGGLFLVTLPAGRAELAIREGEDLRNLDGAEVSLGSEAATLAVSAAGRHFRGLVEGELVTHGHRKALPDGRCGLFYDGVGSVRLVELRVFPIE